MHTPPQHRNVWSITIPHPLAGLPLTEQITDAEADAHAASQAPEGWHLEGPSVQGRDRHLRRVLVVTYVRNVPNPTDPWQTPVIGRPIVTLL